MENIGRENWPERMRNIIPWGSSTCSKAPAFLPEEPGVIVEGRGCRVWDERGREYIDFRNGLGPVTLGYKFPEVDRAIREQLEKGIVFGHPHPLECEVAERLSRVIPCAEQVRFLKTGGEAIAACIRIARYHTGREHIVQIGYNGWLNSLAEGIQVLPGVVANAAPPGVPICLSELHHVCRWNDMEGMKKLFSNLEGKIAAVVIAADYKEMEAGREFYSQLGELTRKNRTLMIFDEIVTGFRVAVGGVQEYFGVKPDMAVFSKGIANGMPLSALVGKREIMSCCDRGGAVTVSSTFGGESLSLAAAKAVIHVYETRDVIGHLWKQGEKLWGGLNKIFETHDIPLELKGFWPCAAFSLKEADCQHIWEKFFRAAYKNGVSLYNISYVNYSHKDDDIEEALARLEKACKEIKA